LFTTIFCKYIVFIIIVIYFCCESFLFIFWGMLLQFYVRVVSFSICWCQPIRFISRHVPCDTTYDKQCNASLICPPPLPRPKKLQQIKKILFFPITTLFILIYCFYVPDKWIVFWFSLALLLWYKSLVIFLLGQWIRCHHFGGDLGFSWSEGSWFDGHENFCWRRFVTDICLSIPWCLLNDKLYA
jgi:hypothetical protein